MAPTSEHPWTADELHLYEGRCELIDGRIVPLSPPGGEHAVLSVGVAAPLATFVRAHKLGFVLGGAGFVIRRNPDTVRAPDAAFLSFKRAGDRMSPSFLTCAPELVVEVVAPNDRRSEIDAKVQMWCEFGVDVTWVVDPRRREVRVVTRAADGSAGPSRTLVVGDVLDGAPALPGFTLPVADVFE